MEITEEYLLLDPAIRISNGDGIVTDQLKREFESNGRPFSGNVTCERRGESTYLVFDRRQGYSRKYLCKYTDDGIEVYLIKSNLKSFWSKCTKIEKGLLKKAGEKLKSEGYTDREIRILKKRMVTKFRKKRAEKIKEQGEQITSNIIEEEFEEKSISVKAESAKASKFQKQAEKAGQDPKPRKPRGTYQKKSPPKAAKPKRKTKAAPKKAAKKPAATKKRKAPTKKRKKAAPKPRKKKAPKRNSGTKKK